MALEAPVNRFTIYRGTAPKLRFTVEPITVPSADPVSGWTTNYTFRRLVTSADPVVLQVSGSWNSDESTIDVSLTRTQTLALTAGAYVGALFRTTSGSEDELSRDVITVAESVHDAP